MAEAKIASHQMSSSKGAIIKEGYLVKKVRGAGMALRETCFT